jgi:hypothetical protein
MPGYYRLRATDTGFQLSWVGNTMSINIDDDGSHGPIAELYQRVDQVFHDSRKEAERSHSETE